jgi:phosphoglycerate kinase
MTDNLRTISLENIANSFFNLESYPPGIKGKTAIVRLDLNSPINKDTGKIITDPRIREHARTVSHLIDHRCSKIILLSHQGRKGKHDFISLKEHAKKLSEYINKRWPIKYMWANKRNEEIFKMGENAVIGDEVIDYISKMKGESIILLENTRLLPYEDAGKTPSDYKETKFVKRLSNLKNSVFVLDGFSVAHRPHCSVVGLTYNLDSIAGEIMNREIEQMKKIIVDKIRPVTLVCGGGKIFESVESLETFLANDSIDNILTCGLVGLIFLYAGGKPLGRATEEVIRSNFKNDQRFNETIKRIEDILKKIDYNRKIFVPDDVAIDMGNGFKNVKPIDKLEETANGRQIKDIGIVTAAKYVVKILESRTIIMNGTPGVYELANFQDSTDQITRAIADAARWRDAVTLIGGGDTLAACENLPAIVSDSVRRSLSGKAFLKTLASGSIETLPGIHELIRSKENFKKQNN